MKIAYHSDLHYEFKRFDEEFLLKKSFDVLVLAGDIGTYHTIEEAFDDIDKRVEQGIPIIFVPGNHDYYGGAVDSRYLERLCKKRVMYGNRQVFVINGQRFVCCTGWTDFGAIGCNWSANQLFKQISDKYEITGWTFERQLYESALDYSFLKDNIQTGDVVVTHFPPTLSLNNPRFPITKLSHYWNNSWEELFDNAPKLWIYGHTHGNVNKQLGDTFAISNQRGYPSEKYWNTYDNNGVIEI